MTLIELCFLLMIPVTMAMGAVIVFDAPPLFAFGLALLGCLAYTVLIVALLAVLSALCAVQTYIASWRTGHPHIPPCEQCGGAEFTCDRERGDDVWRCRCGQHYARRGLQCLLVLPGGATTPYRRWRPFRRWHDDHTAIAAPVPPPYRGADLPS